MNLNATQVEHTDYHDTVLHPSIAIFLKRSSILYHLAELSTTDLKRSIADSFPEMSEFACQGEGGCWQGRYSKIETSQ